MEFKLKNENTKCALNNPFMMMTKCIQSNLDFFLFVYLMIFSKYIIIQIHVCRYK